MNSRRQSAVVSWHGWRRDISNFSLLRHRHYAGFLVSMHQSGTHWLKHMLALAIAARYDLPPPRYNHANDIIGGPKDPTVQANAPRLAASHAIPHRLVASAWFRRLVTLPRYVVLVRDPRAALASNYEKWSQRYQVSFLDYLHGDPSGHRFNSDIWWCFRFLNSWGRIAELFPHETLIVRYEQLLADPGAEIIRVNEFWNLDLGSDAISDAVSGSSKQAMAAKHDPARPPGEVTVASRDVASWYGPQERELLVELCSAYLRYDFGYDFDT